MININDKVIINSNDYFLAFKTLLEEMILFYRASSDPFVKDIFNSTEVTENAGISYHFNNYQKLQEDITTLKHLIGFDLTIPNAFDFGCNNKLEVTLAIKSEWCSDTVLLQNKLFDLLRYTLKNQTFYWEGEIATDVNSTNDQNTNTRKYRIITFSEINPNVWGQSRLSDNYVLSQMNFTFNIFNIL